MFGTVRTAQPYPPTLGLRLIGRGEQARYDDLMGQYHRRGALRRIGHELHYVATDSDGGWMALVSFSPAALKCAARDRWIGWHRQHRTDRLRLIANNSRFLILPGQNHPNLATRVLSACRHRLADDWHRQFCKPLVMLETFVDSQHHVGTIYRADNWTMVGETRGYRRIAGGYCDTPVESVKLVFVKPLRRDARRILCAPQLSPAYRYGVERMKLNDKDFRSLLEHFEKIGDFRRAHGLRHRLPTVLALVAAAMLSGARGYKDIHIWCDELSQANRSHFRCRYRRGRREVPSVTVIRRVMVNVTPEVLQGHINDFCARHFGTPDEPVAVDGKVLCGSGDTDRRQVHVLNAIGHDSGYCYEKKKSARCR